MNEKLIHSLSPRARIVIGYADRFKTEHTKMNDKILTLSIGLLFSLAGPNSLNAQSKPLVLGRGVERFEAGKVLHRDDFDNLDNWVVQIEERDSFPKPHVKAKNQTLDSRVPGRGCTIWFKEKLKNRLAITYEVVCPEPIDGVRGLEPKDVNNFWLASDPDSETGDGTGLFDTRRYDGGFGSYSKMNGYYASTGGGRNKTTRMRRYPREKNGQPFEHIALNDRDGKKEYMIPVGKVMQVQLVAFDDLLQYIVDGRIVYEIAFDDEVTVEKFKHGKKKQGVARYQKDKFPFYEEGFFGFRMVGTQHVYSKFRVYELKPIDNTEDLSNGRILRP